MAEGQPEPAYPRDEETVKRARIDYPKADIRREVFRALDFPDDDFDGYWSIRVIEHFWTEYNSIVAQAARVLKLKGLPFLTTSWFLWYRQRKARAGEYPTMDFSWGPDTLYRFALGREEICAGLGSMGSNWKAGGDWRLTSRLETTQRYFDVRLTGCPAPGVPLSSESFGER